MTETYTDTFYDGFRNSQLLIALTIFIFQYLYKMDHFNMPSFECLYHADKQRYKNGGGCFFNYILRRYQTSKNKFLKLIYKLMVIPYNKLHCMEIPLSLKVGKGFYIGHPYCITINPRAVLGENINIHKGVLIGQENRGRRKGTPTIGNCVWIGINSSIVGNVTIGDDVLIAPNTYINCDVPSHSIVFGNPCVIKHRENATEAYINNKV